MPSTLRHTPDDPHDAPIAPDIVPADWAGRGGPPLPANDALSREKLFAEIRHAAKAAAPAVDNTFRATDVNDIPALKNRTSARTWMRRAFTAFVFALVSAVAAAAWKHHGDAATQTMANWVPLLGATSSPATEAPAAAEQTETAAQPATDEHTATQPMRTASTAALPPEAEQQIQSMTRDLAAMGQQIEQLKATIEQLRANQQAAVPPAGPAAARPSAPKPKMTALPPRPPAPPAAHPPRQAYPPAMQAQAVPPPAPAAAAPPPAYQAPQQATTQPNGEPVVRPPMPMPLSDRY